MAARIESVTVDDGSFDLPLWVPDRGAGPGIVVIQEIFGVGPYIEKVAENLADLGYTVGAPDLFWRIERNWNCANDAAGMAEGMRMASQFDFAGGVSDCGAAVAHMRTLPEVSGGIGTVGFCLGGSLGYVLAAEVEAEGDARPDVTVAFYGSRIDSSLDLLERITSPLLFVYGGSDPFIPRDRVAQVETAAHGRDNVEFHVAEAAGHAFHNHEAPQLHHPEAAAEAWDLTVNFLARHLPPG